MQGWMDERMNKKSARALDACVHHYQREMHANSRTWPECLARQPNMTDSSTLKVRISATLSTNLIRRSLFSSPAE
jgi:hypothetical protein